MVELVISFLVSLSSQELTFLAIAGIGILLVAAIVCVPKGTRYYRDVVSAGNGENHTDYHYRDYR